MCKKKVGTRLDIRGVFKNPPHSGMCQKPASAIDVHKVRTREVYFAGLEHTLHLFPPSKLRRSYGVKEGREIMRNPDFNMRRAHTDLIFE